MSPLRRVRSVLDHLLGAAPTSSSSNSLTEAEPRAPGQDLGPWPARNVDDGTCGMSEGYPKWQNLTDLYADRAAQEYLRAGCAVCPKHRVGNYAGLPGEAGFELTFRHNTIRATSAAPSALTESSGQPFTYKFAGAELDPNSYLDRHDVTGLLIAKGGQILSEHYRHERSSEMRFTSWCVSIDFWSICDLFAGFHTEMASAPGSY